jgi:hypothetical protein
VWYSFEGVIEYREMPYQRAIAIEVERSPYFFFNLMDGNPLTMELAILVFEEMHAALPLSSE